MKRKRKSAKVQLPPKTLDEAEARLEGVQWKPDGSFTALCPAHDDHRNSLSVSEGDDGKLLMHCHANCEYEEVIEALSTIKPKGKSTNKERTKTRLKDDLTPVPFVDDDMIEPDYERICGFDPIRVYHYTDDRGRTRGYIVRSAEKRFMPITPWRTKEGEIVWRPKGFDRPRPLYNLEELANADDGAVLVVEGEKTADAARDLITSHTVTTWHGGAKAIARTDWTPLAGRDVVLWPDADPPGLEAVDAIARELRCIGAKSVRIVNLPDGLPKGWDLADDIPEGIDMDIDAMIKGAAETNGNLANYLLTASSLAELDLPPREMIIKDVLPCASLSLIFAKRGVGKTWLGLGIAVAVASGENFIAYDVPEARRVIFIDGEMPAADLQKRIVALGAEDLDNLAILSSEVLYRQYRALNINKDEDRDLIDAMLDQQATEGKRAELVIMDNLSSLRMGVEENENSALDSILSWLMSLRHKGYAVAIVHHAGKSGDQRGASRLEDLLDVSIKLEATEGKGASFEMTFVKMRGLRPDPDHLLLTLEEDEDGILKLNHREAVKKSPKDDTLRAIYLGLEGDGSKPFDSQKALAIKVDLQTPAVSKHITALRKGGLVDEKVLTVTDKGKERLSKLFDGDTFE